jgi:hypothetical protein
MSTSVTRDVYTKDGKLLYHDTWYSSYRSSPKLVRIGPKPDKKKPAATEKKPAATEKKPATPASTLPTQ